MQIESNENGDKNYNTEIKTIFDKWFPKIERIIFTINSHFSNFMQSMGYVGEVKLIRKEEVYFHFLIYTTFCELFMYYFHYISLTSIHTALRFWYNIVKMLLYSLLAEMFNLEARELWL